MHFSTRATFLAAATAATAAPNPSVVRPLYTSMLAGLAHNNATTSPSATALPRPPARAASASAGSCLALAEAGEPVEVIEDALASALRVRRNRRRMRRKEFSEI
ncbi:hypothetical protein VUR80DRAFT_3710 [Thermomyces stellatus]